VALFVEETGMCLRGLATVRLTRLGVDVVLAEVGEDVLLTDDR
jgi:hypothetical protein